MPFDVTLVGRMGLKRHSESVAAMAAQWIDREVRPSGLDPLHTGSQPLDFADVCNSLDP